VEPSAPAAPTPVARPGFSASATNALRGLQLRTGFRIQLVAADPLISNPVALAFDANGRLFVAEQPLNGAEGRIKLLEDADGDGVFDSATAFADKLNSPSALVCYGDGLFVASGTQILFLADKTGDGIADVRREVFDGFNATGANATASGGLNNLVWGPDNRIHGATAGAMGDITCQAIPTTQALTLAGNDIAFDPRTLVMELEPGTASRGVSFDNAGRRFTASPGRPAYLSVVDPIRAARNPLIIWPELTADLTPTDPVGFTLAPVAGPDGRVQPLFVPARYTRISGLLLYRGGALPANFVNNVFFTDPVLRVVSRWQFRENALVPAIERPAAEASSEFLASAEPSFRPVQIISGPDGTLYIADQARERLEQIRAQGRIWRITPANYKSPKPPQLSASKTAELVGLLTSPAGWTRDTAARLLFERRDTNAVPLLVQQLARASSPLTRLSALQVLHGLEALTEAHLILALRDRDEAVRARAMQLASEFIHGGLVSDALWNQVAAATSDRSDRVRVEAAFALGLAQRPDVADRLAELAANSPDNRIVQLAVLTAAGGRAISLLQELAGNPRLRDSAIGWDFMQQLAMMTGQESASGMDALLRTLTRSAADAFETLALARAVGEGLQTAGRSFVATAPDETWRDVGLRALDIGVGSGPANTRAEAIRFVGVSGYTQREVGDWLLALLVPAEPQAVQSAAIDALARFGDPRVTAAFIQRWPGLSTESQRDIVTHLLERFDSTMSLMTALEQNRIPRAALTDVQINFLRSHRNPDTAARAVALYGPPGQRGLAERFAGVLKLTGSAARGREVFINRCAACHRLDGEGRAYGPDLDTVRTRSPEKLLQDILEPDTEVRPEYQTHVVQRTDNTLLFGLLSQPGRNMYAVRMPGVAPLFIPAAQVAETLPQDWSLMPQAASAGLSAGALADLLALLTQSTIQP
jgi:putative membrane-bound dehydrogenase-like protein